jgi:hypothetical protein
MNLNQKSLIKVNILAWINLIKLKNSIKTA